MARQQTLSPLQQSLIREQQSLDSAQGELAIRRANHEAGLKDYHDAQEQLRAYKDIANRRTSEFQVAQESVATIQGNIARIRGEIQASEGKITGGVGIAAGHRAA
jgi:predicted  nucleic acid-binding Zn-ribbon protein